MEIEQREHELLLRESALYKYLSEKKGYAPYRISRALRCREDSLYKVLMDPAERINIKRMIHLSEELPEFTMMEILKMLAIDDREFWEFEDWEVEKIKKRFIYYKNENDEQA